MDKNNMRIGDAEREKAVAKLGDYHVSGHLSSEELDRRINQALGALTAGALAKVTEDLPEQPAKRSPAVAFLHSGYALALLGISVSGAITAAILFDHVNHGRMDAVQSAVVIMLSVYAFLAAVVFFFVIEDV